jgi:hypothetical protein
METSGIISGGGRLLALCLAVMIAPAVHAQTQIDQIIDTGVKRNEESRESQQRVDKIAESTDKVVANYKRELKVIDGLKVYNALLQKQLDDQNAELRILQESIEEVAIIQRQIVPLMMQMLDSLGAFVELDVPFLLEERRNRVKRLSASLERADVTAAEKFRAVLEAFQIENDYGRTIEAYKGTLDGREVDFLRIGRVALLYQSVGGQQNGYWDQARREWVTLTEPEYRNYITRGLQIARKQVAPDLLMIPVSAAEAAR